MATQGLANNVYVQQPEMMKKKKKTSEKKRKNERKNFMANTKWFAAAIVFHFEWRANKKHKWRTSKMVRMLPQVIFATQVLRQECRVQKDGIESYRAHTGWALVPRLSKTNFSSEFIYSIAHNSVLAVFWLLISPLRMVMMMDGMQHHHICSTHLPIDLGYNRLI